jgi:outer membrane protein OmpA-like peptidoglycan-associated protein
VGGLELAQQPLGLAVLDERAVHQLAERAAAAVTEAVQVPREQPIQPRQLPVQAWRPPTLALRAPRSIQPSQENAAHRAMLPWPVLIVNDRQPGNLIVRGAMSRSSGLRVYRRGVRAPRSTARARPSRSSPAPLHQSLGNQGLLRLLRAIGAPSLAVARRGVTGGGSPLPHLDRIQAAFGPEHDLSNVRAHLGGPAADASRAMGASAYTLGHDVAFGASPTLEEAAHEAAHVVQQRQAASPLGDRGPAGARLESAADAVSARVARGEPAAPLLGPAGGPAAGEARSVQRRLLATESTPGGIGRFRAMAEPASGLRLLWDPGSHAVNPVGSGPAPATSPAFEHHLTTIMSDPAQDAEVTFGEHQSGPGAGGPTGVLGGLFPQPTDLTGSRVQLIDMDDLEAMERGAPGQGVASLAHELVENYSAHAFVPTPGVDRFPLAHQVASEAESDVAEDLVGPGRFVAQAISVLSPTHVIAAKDFENYYVVLDINRAPSSPPDAQVTSARNAPRVRLSFNTVDSYVTGSDTPPAAAAAVFASVGATLAANPTATVRIEGFTDNVGAPADNIGLGERRAENAKTAMVAAFAAALGPAGDLRLYATGIGASRFVATNATEAGRAANRRIEITVDRPGP